MGRKDSEGWKNMVKRKRRGWKDGSGEVESGREGTAVEERNGAGPAGLDPPIGSINRCPSEGTAPVADLAF